MPTIDRISVVEIIGPSSSPRGIIPKMNAPWPRQRFLLSHVCWHGGCSVGDPSTETTTPVSSTALLLLVVRA